MPEKLTIEILRKTAEEKGLKLLSTEYKNTLTPVLVECPVHGQFEMIPKKIRKNNGCKPCSYKKEARSNARNLEEAKKIIEEKGFKLINHPDPNTISVEDKITLYCRKHGEFKSDLYKVMTLSRTCRSCGYEEASSKNKTPIEDIQKQANKLNVTFLERKKNPKNGRYLLKLNCKEHGDFEKDCGSFFDGQGCPNCGDNRGIDKRRSPIEKIEKILKEKEYLLLDTFTSMNQKIKLSCPKHGEFSSRVGDIKKGHGCRKCGYSESAPQDSIINLIKNLNLEVIEEDRTIAKPKELDAYIPSKQLAIEYCGLHWHSEEKRGRQYHKEKMSKCNLSGVSLLTIFEDEWLERQEQVKLFIKAKLGATQKLNGRDCSIQEIDKKIAKEFLDKFHIQGHAPSLIYFGLVHKAHGLVGVMSGGKHHRGKSNALILNRLCFGEFSVRGGASKLLKSLINWAKGSNYSTIITWSDSRWSDGGVYKAMKFQLDREYPPDYSYFKQQVRLSKQSCTKKALLKKGAIGNTEAEMAKSLKLSRIWDCGKKRWIMNL